jgi:Transposase DNA-binding/Transposase Tn5 dimerisation domain
MLGLWGPAAVWAEQTFGTAELGDRRRTRRLVRTAARIADHPQGSLPAKFDWNGLRAAYRLVNRPEVTHEQVAGPHYRQVREAMAGEPLVLVVHDTTELDFTSHRALRGTGPLGSTGPRGTGGGRGLLQHNSLAIRPDGRLLGLAYQQVVPRRAAPPGETKAQRRRRQRESRLWLRGVEALGPAPQGSAWVDVADCGGDLFDAMHAARGLGHHFLIRVAQDRKVRVGPPGGQRQTYLRRHARQLAPQASGTVAIAGKGGRPARQAAVALAAAAVWVCPPWPESKRADARPALPAWVERIWEPDPPPGVEPLEWVLISSLPVESAEDLRQRQAWYARRWPTAEEFHQVEKTGCGEEDLRFETAEAMGPMLALLSVVAVRILQLREAARHSPEAPAAQVASALERQLVAAATPGGPSAAALTVRQFVRGVARLGGFLGRRRDGSPGWKTLWRGYQRLQDMVEGVARLGTAGRQAPPSVVQNRNHHPPQKCW